MTWLIQGWFRLGDRELDRPVQLPDREDMEVAEWNTWVGARGERLARKRLWRTGRKVLFRNYRPDGGGEVDVIYRDGDVLVFGEVKTRTSDHFGRPGDAVDRAKRRLVIHGANAWLRELNHPEVLFRFDVIEVMLLDGEPPRIEIEENAFTTPQVGLGM